MPAFQDYNMEDFLQESSFCRYCAGTDARAVAFWEAWIKEHPAKKPAVKEAKELYYILNGNITATGFLQQRQKFEQTFQQHLQGEEVTAIGTRHLPIRRFLARAALIALLISLAGYSVYQFTKRTPHADYSSLAGERKSFQLPDGTSVMLNANSHITVANDFNKGTREITLSGEAFFDVAGAATKPFIVHTTRMDIRVLGTAFNVKAYPQDKSVETALIRGKVEVTIKGAHSRKIMLAPAQKLVLPEIHASKSLPAVATIGTLTINPRDSVALETSWTRNRLVLNDIPLGVAAIEMERWYGVKITVDTSIANKYKYTAIFEKETVEQALQAMQLSVPFHYRKINNEIFISQ
ncbi:FecR family protein [Chitinophaga niastensis]|uniref:FecR family protein n=1 Tax=Chitinophaga niastensis TaxID=536980 RepID=A0A2P8HLW8_CHINA|nr:FecR domain-containing protein [Chitinophaga niastensis]PSL47203.1 FecR family protein [Chitinophaga niastensis]